MFYEGILFETKLELLNTELVRLVIILSIQKNKVLWNLFKIITGDGPWLWSDASSGLKLNPKWLKLTKVTEMTNWNQSDWNWPIEIKVTEWCIELMI